MAWGCDPGSTERGQAWEPSAQEDEDEGEDAGEPGDPGELPTSTIYGGTDVGTCGWPSTVNLSGSCSGTLVAPDVVIYAAHCGANHNWVRFGENAFSGAGKWVPTQNCAVYPGGGPGSGDDFAYCVLAETVDDVPIVPILMGCETNVLTPGKQTTIVGFGESNTGPYGIKREVTAPVQALFASGEIRIGGGGKDSCQGDSGGPVFVQLDDGSWRVFGITSYGGACGTGGFYSMMHNGMAWFESQTGRDLTPCHDADGTWNPGEDCGGFPDDPAAPTGSWAGQCGGAVTGFSSTCGEPFGDATPPEEEDEPGNDNVELYSGSLSGAGDVDYQPDGTFWLAEAGLHQSALQGAAGTDFDLFLYRWTGSQWTNVAQGTTASSAESVSYNGAAGYYLWVVRSYSGSGSYDLALIRP